ncbi:MAG: alanyl-tRNA editing protein [Acidobacteria bacterium]|nr:alanyl-tRNA editing protein [Acidobacteriota bacterium]
MTDRLYYTDSYLREFRASIVDRAGDGCRLYLDRTAFYPTSGGQPFDTGLIAGAPVVDVVDEGDRIAHVLAEPVDAAGEAECRIDWDRRFDHMQQHSGQHLLSAVFAELFALPTVSVHFGADSATLDLEAPSLGADQILDAEIRANRLVCENRPISVAFAESSADLGLRKASQREGSVRIVVIDGLDRSACGGTHVRATGEIGPIFLRKQDKVRNSVRVEFLCGLRAFRRARADFQALSQVAQVFSGLLDDAPELVRAQSESLRALEKQRRALESELAAFQGRDLYERTAPDPAGLRRAVERRACGPLDGLRGLAQSFCSRPRAIFVGIVEEPPSLLLATSEDSGCDAGKTLRAALTAAGGRGGGSARLAQGSVPSRQAIEPVLAALQ